MIMSANSVQHASVNFQTLRGRVTVLGIFAFSWFMQAVRRIVEHEAVGHAVWGSLGFSVALLPLIAVAAWALWKVLFKGKKGLFAFSLATVTATYSVYVLAAGR